MLNIYRGGELTDREKFIFDHVKGKTLLIVPDQFSLQRRGMPFLFEREKPYGSEGRGFLFSGS